MLTARGEIQGLSINWKGMKFKMEKEELIESKGFTYIWKEVS